jgi:hypothetical protein
MMVFGQAFPASHNIVGSHPGLLNPDWVEALMGLPAGWTACGSSATESCPPPQSEPSAPFTPDSSHEQRT